MKKIFLIALISLSLNCLADNYDPLKGFSTGLNDFMPQSHILDSARASGRMTQEQKDILKEKKLNPSIQCLIEQIKKGKIDNVQLLLNFGLNPNSSYYSDYPVYIAAKYNKPEIVRALVEKGAMLDRGFYSELYETVKHKDNDLAMYLINNNAKINYQDSVTNNTVLSMAIKNKMYDVAKVLIQKGAKADNLSMKLVKKKKLTWLVEEALMEKGN